MIKLNNLLNESSPIYKDWDEFVRPDYILVTLKNGKKLKIDKKRVKGGSNVYNAILKAFNDDNHRITNKVVSAMLGDLGEIVNEDEYVDQAYTMGDTPTDNPIDDYDELDVEQEDMDDFIAYLKSYSNELTEANCPCVFEAEYQGREVKLGKPTQGDVKKFKVYVKNPKTGKVIKVNFGEKGAKIKKSNPERRKSFRARHNCENPGPRTKARYWSCRKW